jgi:O-antigen ligase
VGASSRPIALGIFYALLGLVVLSPFPFGAARDWAWLPLCIGVTTLATVFFALLAVRGESPVTLPALSPLKIPLLLFSLVLLWAALQTASFTPAAWHHPLWQQAGEALGKPLQSSIALDTQRTYQHILRFFSYALVFVLTALLTHNAKRAETTLRALSFAALGYACYGLWIYFNGNTSILWTAKWAYFKDLTSTFVNRNSYATFAGVGTVCLLSLWIQQLQRIIEKARLRRRALTQRVLKELLKPRSILLLTAVFLVLSTVLLSNSRAGLFSTLGGIFTLIGLSLQRTRLSRWRKLLLGFVVIGILIAMIVASSTRTVGRLSDTNVTEEGRLPVYSILVESIYNAPLTGFGLGNFANTFPLYRDHTVEGYYDRAHHDYLELIFELGIPAALLFYTSILWVIVICLRGIKRRRQQKIYPTLAVAASVLVGAHALIDFSLQMPSIAVFYAMILGLGYGQSVTRSLS